MRTPVSRAWDFGDGTLGTGPAPTHTYAVAGNYTVTVTVTDSNGASSSTSKSIVVQADAGPTSSFTFTPTVPDVGEAVTFTSTSQASQGAIVDWDWDFDGDDDFTDFTGQVAPWAFDSPGTHIVKLRAEQTNGQFAVGQASLRVNGLPSADFTWTPPAPVAGGSVDLVSTSTDFEGPLAAFSWDLDGDGLFGDGSEAQIRQPFPDAGTYDIGLQVTDSDGAVSTVRKDVVVAELPPPPPPTPPILPSEPDGRHRAERRVEPALAHPHAAPAAHEPVPGHPHSRHGAAPRSADRRALRAGAARLADTGALRGQRLSGQLGGHHERHAAGPIPQVRAQAAGGHPPQAVRAAGEPDRQVHELPDPSGRAAEARGPVPVPDTALSRTVPMTRTWTAALAVIAFAAAFLAASVALGGEAESDGSDRTTNVRLASVAALPTLAKDPAVELAQARAERRERLSARASGRAAARRAAAAEVPVEAPVPAETPDAHCTRARRAAPGGCPRASSGARARTRTGPRDLRRRGMRVIARKPPPPGLGEGGVVDGYVVESLVADRGHAELICNAVGPDGEAVTLVVAWRRPSDSHAWSRFSRLARTRAMLEHDALLPVLAVGEHSGRPYLAMGRYPETTFEDLLAEAPLPPRQVLELLAPVCDALDLAHAHGLVHQSLSDTSLLVDDDSMFLDGFGIASGPRELAFESAGVREVRYCPPEELRGEALEPAGNVYTLASLLLHALTGRPPYEGAPAVQAYGHLWSPRRRPSAHMPQLGTAFDDVIARGMAKDPAERPASASELLAAAAGALGVDLPSRRGSAGVEERGPRRPAAIRIAPHPEAGGGRGRDRRRAGRTGGGRRARSVRRQSRLGRGAERRAACARAPRRRAHGAQGEAVGQRDPAGAGGDGG